MRIFYLILVILLAAGRLSPAFGGEQSSSLASPGSSSPTPSPTAIPLSLELYFQRAAKIFPEPSEKNFEIVEEVPFLTQNDFRDVKVKKTNQRYCLAISLTPPGQQKLMEAGMGNFGRTVVVVMDGTIRDKFNMVPKNQPLFYLSGSFSKKELFQLADQVNRRPSPTPSPAALPTPSPRQKISVY